jgi:PAS domain S-box-containing protein
MDIAFDDIAALFEDDVTGGGAAGAVKGLQPCAPSLVVLADASGNLSASDPIETPFSEDEVRLLAADMARRLSGDDACRFPVDVGGEQRIAAAVRLPDSAGSFVLGCVLRSEKSLAETWDEPRIAAEVAAAVAWASDHHRAANQRLQTRVDHLVAERHMLKESHADAIAAAIEERETRLREQESHLSQLRAVHLQNEMILNSAGEGILGVDSNGRMIFVNPTAARMLGYKVEELIGLPAHETVHHRRPDGTPYPRTECPMFRALAGSDASVSSSETYWRKDGTSFPVDNTSTPLLDGGKVAGAVITFQDITQRRMLEARLRQAQKMESIGQLAAGIAHEINTPTQYIGDNARFLEDVFGDMRSLLSACSELRRATEENRPIEPVLQHISAAVEKADVEYLLEEIPKAIAQSLEGVQRVAKIVRSMKEFSHPGGEEKQAIDLNRAIESTLTVSRNEWKYVADTQTDFDTQLPLVPCLPGDLNQVILNLVVNSAHAVGDKVGTSGEKGTIAVSTRRDGDWAEIRIHDTGTGIPEAVRAKVYDPFFTTKPVGKGTGQGLAIAHSIICEKHHGSIDFETESGQGTTFIIRLPLRETPATAGAH